MIISEWSTRLLDLESELLNALPDEKFAIMGIGKAIRRKAALMSELERPFGQFLLVGPPDRAKKLAAELARFLFGNEDNTLCLQMENYSERHKLHRLIGHWGGFASPYAEEGDLTTPIWRRPETVVVLEEAQHAHLEAWKGCLLPILEEGFIIDGIGRRISYKNSVLFLSTTVGWVEGSESEIFGTEARDLIQQHFIAEVLHAVDAILPLGIKRH